MATIQKTRDRFNDALFWFVVVMFDLRTSGPPDPVCPSRLYF